MAGLETALPREQQFEYIVSSELDYYLASPDINIEKYQDVLNPYVEFTYDITKIWELSLGFARLLRNENENPQLVQATIYRSMLFGIELAEAIATPSRDGALPLGELVNGCEDAAAAIRQEVSQYLSDRPHIYELIDLFVAEIDDSGLRNHHVETGAGIMLLLNERRHAANYAQKLVGGITPEDFNR